MKALILLLITIATVMNAAEVGIYEMRVYYAAPGRLDDLNARFRNHTMKLFEKHGMVNYGYWTPVDNPDRKLIYILGYPDREAARASWKAFASDPEWQKVVKASEASGKLVARFQSTFLKPTDYSPTVQNAKEPKARTFELRTYKATPGKLDDLNARFRNHTLNLFSKHGMTHYGYWTPLEAGKGADDTLIYILAHKSQEAAQESFKAFRADPDWVAARKASEEKAGGSLTVKVDSEFMKPTDYSPTK
ncbi:MAG TPA: NIPSNAP family protein [Verrucomicrobiae bacterium]|nr:NIPSNAP family protein [Verrucomicrobiae bacterium]